MICGRCGNQVQDGDRYCEFCGTPIRVEKDNDRTIEKRLARGSLTWLMICIVAVIGVMLWFAVGRRYSSVSSAGNTSGNIANGGMVCESGGWIYYTYHDRDSNQGSIYKMRDDGGQKQLLQNTDGCFLNVVGDWLFYYERNTDDFTYRLVRIKTDGTMREALGYSSAVPIPSAVYLYSAENWLFYPSNVEYVEESGINRMKVGAINPQTICEKSKVVGIDKDKIICLEEADEGEVTLYTINFDGSDKKVIEHPAAASWNDGIALFETVVADGHVYHIDEQNQKVFKVLLDGTGEWELPYRKYFYFNVGGGWIYYCTAALDASDGMYRMKSDGSSEEKLNSLVGHIFYTKNWLFCYADKGGLYRMHHDGSDCQLIS